LVGRKQAVAERQGKSTVVKVRKWVSNRKIGMCLLFSRKGERKKSFTFKKFIQQSKGGGPVVGKGMGPFLKCVKRNSNFVGMEKGKENEGNSLEKKWHVAAAEGKNAVRLVSGGKKTKSLFTIPGGWGIQDHHPWKKRKRGKTFEKDHTARSTSFQPRIRALMGKFVLGSWYR